MENRKWAILFILFMLGSAVTPIASADVNDFTGGPSWTSASDLDKANGWDSRFLPTTVNTFGNMTIPADKRVPVVIVFENDTNRKRATFRDIPLRVTGGRTVDFLPVLFADVPSQSIEKIETRDEVESVYRNQRIAVSPVDTAKSVSHGSLEGQATDQQIPWGVRRIHAREAAQAVSDSAMSEISVAILDTGIDYTHPDLEKTVSWGANFTNGVSEYGLSTSMDDAGHGTAVAGIVAAENDGSGTVGVAPGVELYSVKVLDKSGTGRYSWAISGIDAALKGPDGELGTHDDAKVLSISFGGNETDAGLRTTIEHAREYAVVVSSAGNGGDGNVTTNEVTYPARYDGSIAVAATNKSDKIPTFSAEGDEIELAAPGVNVRTTALGGGEKYFSGTSAAAPHVSGVAALLIATDLANDKRDLAPRDIRYRLRESAFDIEATGEDRRSGYGLIQAKAAVDTITPEFVVSKLDPNMSVLAGTPIDVRTTIENIGTGDTRTIELYLAGEKRKQREVTLAAGEQNNISFTNVSTNGLTSGGHIYTVQTPNDSQSGILDVHTESNFTVAEITPMVSTARVGGQFDVRATIVNVGQRATESVSLVVNETSLDTARLTLNTSENESITLSGSTSDFTVGNYTYTVLTDHDEYNGSLIVEMSLEQRYDANNDTIIDTAEIRTAIRDWSQGTGPSTAELRRLIQLWSQGGSYKEI